MISIEMHYLLSMADNVGSDLLYDVIVFVLITLNYETRSSGQSLKK